jgi:Zn-dependent M28 family amino/carboxypeptidase
MTENQNPTAKRGWRIGLFFRALQNTVFVVWLVVALISMSVTTTIWAAYATWKATQLTYRVAELSYQNRKAIARALAKARLRRLATAVPFVGAGAAVYFERQTYQEWLEVNPEGSASDYACDMAAVTAEVMDEVFQDLPKAIRPSERMLRSFVPDCKAP